jgi:hypothetical protein
MQKSSNFSARRQHFLTIFRNWKLMVSLVVCLVAAAMTLAAAGGNVNTTEISATLQEPFIVKLKQPLRRSPSLRGEIEQVKAVARSEGLFIDQWFASPEGLLLRMTATAHLDQRTKDGILQRLNRLSSVELATTASGAAGQVHPVMLANAFASDTDIPEARLRGFRDFDKGRF